MKLNPYKITDLSEGILQAIANTIVPVNSVYFSVNLLFDKKVGYAVVRNGIEKLGNALSGVCNGIFQFIKTDGSKKLISAFGTSIYYLDNSNVWQVGTTILNVKVRFLTFANTVLALDGTNKKTSADGEAWVTTGGNLDVGNMPAGKYAVNWKDKVYIAGVSANPDRLFFSSLYGVPDAGKISWTDETAGNIDIDPEDGAGGIVGLAKVPGYLLIFKERSIHRWDGRQLFPESLINIGTQSQESIVLGRQSLFFWNERGVFETNGGYPIKISRRIQDIVNAVSPDYNVSGWSDAEYVYFSIGDISLKGINIKSCIIGFHIETQTWTLLSFPVDFRALHKYISGKEYVIGGDTSGQLWILNKGLTDHISDIEYHIQFQNIEIQNRGMIKNISEFFVFGDDIRNATLYGRADEGDFIPLGAIKRNVSSIKEDLSGNYIDLRISGMGKAGVTIRGIELPQLSIDISSQK